MPISPSILTRHNPVTQPYYCRHTRRFPFSFEMGNSQAKESRPLASSSRRSHHHGPYGDRHHGDGSRSNRGSRPDLSLLGIGGSSERDLASLEHRRETRQEREARRLEKERVARLKERERSMKEEHVDGGYLVTQGVYTGPEDFNKAVVRQLMVSLLCCQFWPWRARSRC